MPKVSIVVPVYNMQKYLAACIKSLKAQTLSDLEIILVDDGSTDGSGKICDRYQKKDSRIKVIHQENRGLSAARNARFGTAFDFVKDKTMRILILSCRYWKKWKVPVFLTRNSTCDE